MGLYDDIRPDMTLVHSLRAATGSRVLDCKKALIRSGNDYHLAMAFLSDILKTVPVKLLESDNMKLESKETMPNKDLTASSILLIVSPSYEQSLLMAKSANKVDVRQKSHHQGEPLASCIDKLMNCDFVAISTVGKDPFCLLMAGYAFAMHKPIVYFCPGLTGNFNLMLSGSAAAVATSIEELTEHLQQLAIDSHYTKPYLGTVE